MKRFLAARMPNRILLTVLSQLSIAPLFLEALPYEVQWIGISDPYLLQSIQDASHLATLQDRPPASLNGIRYRIANDIPDLLKVMRAYGYYDASIDSDVSLENGFASVSLFFRSGPQYTIGSYQILSSDCSKQAEFPCCDPFSREQLGLPPGAPALSISIVNAELNLLSELSRCGYPLAKIEKRQIVVDMQTKQLDAKTCVDEGPLSQYGPVSISGLQKVQKEFVLKRIGWKEGELYNPDQIQQTQKRLLNSDLFSSVSISHEETLDPNGELPIHIQIYEAKHRQITLGVFYATVDGPGGSFSWTSRNIRGLGETLSLNGEFSQRYLAGSLVYKKPDFLAMDQTYRALAQIEREDIRAYTAFSYRAANFLDKKVDSKSNLSIGLEFQHINVADSASNGTYRLIDLPFMAKCNTADDPLNPAKGYTLVYQPHFFQSLDNSKIHYIKQRLTATFYLPVWKKWLVFAGRFQVGSIAGAKQKDVPLPLLFLGGSEDDLRGYRYLTVSPVNDKNKPYGGRSALFLTAEIRTRFGEKIGIVPFADFGTVTLSETPSVNTKWYKSLGVGLRYFTFFGPLRFDIGFPLDRRHGIDPAFRIYASIGQTF